VGSIPTYLRQIWQVQIKFTRHKWSTHSIKEIWDFRVYWIPLCQCKFDFWFTPDSQISNNSIMSFQCSKLDVPANYLLFERFALLSLRVRFKIRPFCCPIIGILIYPLRVSFKTAPFAEGSILIGLSYTSFKFGIILHLISLIISAGASLCLLKSLRVFLPWAKKSEFLVIKCIYVVDQGQHYGRCYWRIRDVLRFQCVFRCPGIVGNQKCKSDRKTGPAG